MLIFYLAELKLPNEQQLVFKDIYDSLYEYVCATIMKITNDRAVALDLAQDVFVKYIESFDMLPPLPESKAWLGVVARNTAINYNNKRS